MKISRGVVNTDGLELHYDIIGKGEPLLLLGGGPGAHPTYLYPIAESVSEFRQCFILHQRGTGRSIMRIQNSGTVNVTSFINDIEAFRAHLGLDQFSILGHSWGGMLAMSYAAQSQGRVKSMVLIGTPGLDLSYAAYMQDNLRSFLTDKERDHVNYWSHGDRADDPRSQHELSVGFAPSCVFNRSLESVVTAIFMTINSVVESLIQHSLIVDNYDLNDAMSRFIKPVTIIQGRQDYLGEGVACRAHEVFPNSKLIWIEKANHFPWIDSPDICFDSIRDALRV